MKTNEELRSLIMDVLEKHYHGRNFIEANCAVDLMALIQSELYEAYQEGAAAAQSTAFAEIAKNYVAIR